MVVQTNTGCGYISKKIPPVFCGRRKKRSADAALIRRFIFSDGYFSEFQLDSARWTGGGAGSAAYTFGGIDVFDHIHLHRTTFHAASAGHAAFFIQLHARQTETIEQ